MILSILFCLLIILYWFAEGVTEGWTWSTKARQNKNKLIHPNNKSNGIMDYHGWRILENVGIWGAVILAFFLSITIKQFLLLGVGSWFIGTFCYEAALNYVNKGTIYKPVGYKWHILGYDIPWWGGKRIYALPAIGLVILICGIIT
jgi:hypothetical protein|tara:strand:- start:1598 stop:2035 length:438 start_codon:yes stop_codon:yes gene_type:complete